MRLGKVIGTVVATQKTERLKGAKLLIVQELTIEAQATSTFVVCMDAVGAGYGDVVLTCAGSSARLTSVTESAPVDATIIGIVDTVEREGEVVFRKGAEG